MTAVGEAAVYSDEPFIALVRKYAIDIYGYLMQYAEPRIGQQLQAAKDYNYRIRYRPYDWSLNENDAGGNTNDDGH